MKKLVVSLIVLLLMGGVFSSAAFGSGAQPINPDPTSVEAE
jgi:hypothetical protein